METSLDEIRRLRTRALPMASTPIEWPEGPFMLSLEARRGSRVRQFKHIHQSCLLHTENFRAACVIKQVYLLDGYLAMAEAANPYGVYSFARQMLENSGHLYRITSELQAAREMAADKWLDGGQKFFGIIVRAAFGTSQAQHQEALQGAGLSSAGAKSMSSGESMKMLAKAPDHEDAWERYSVLCDFVHHNLGSKTLANQGTRVGGVAVSAFGGMKVLPQDGAITRYQYPSPVKGELAIAETADGFVADSRDCVKWVNEMPPSPYSRRQVMQFTGTELGLTPLNDDLRPARQNPLAGRNDPCPCGSGKKFKNCCLG